MGIFIDLKKAFHTVNHDILLKKLEHSGVRGLSLKWFKSYLQDRRQFIQIGSNKSAFETVQCCVPQGSILGPLMFLVYINDLQNCLTYGVSRLFADDTNILYCGKHIDILKHNAEVDLLNLIDWFNVNKLEFNLNKSNCIVICSKNI